MLHQQFGQPACSYHCTPSSVQYFDTCSVFARAPGLKKFLKKNAVGQTLAVLDAKLGNIIKEKLEIPCVHK